MRCGKDFVVKLEECYGFVGGIFDDGKGVNGFYIMYGFFGMWYLNIFKFNFVKDVWEKKFFGLNNYNLKYLYVWCLYFGIVINLDELVMYGGCLG